MMFLDMLDEPSRNDTFNVHVRVWLYVVCTHLLSGHAADVLVVESGERNLRWLRHVIAGNVNNVDRRRPPVNRAPY